MDKINIEGVILTPLKKITHPRGDILHAMKENDSGYAGFGEAYFSTIKHGEIKGWNLHRKMTLNLVVPMGKVTFVIYDDKDGSNSKENYFKVTLSQTNYQRLTVPPGLWLAFKGIGSSTNLILNVANMEHDSNELDRIEFDMVDYNWESV